MTLGSLSANGWCCVPVLFGIRCPALELAGRWVSWVLVLRWRSLGELSPINITWDWEVSGHPMSWTQLSHLGGSGPTPGQSTKTLAAACHKRKARKQTTKKWTGRTPKQMVKTKLNRKKSYKETYTHTVTKRGKNNFFKWRKRATKPINKTTNENKH